MCFFLFQMCWITVERCGSSGLLYNLSVSQLSSAWEENRKKNKIKPGFLVTPHGSVSLFWRGRGFGGRVGGKYQMRLGTDWDARTSHLSLHRLEPRYQESYKNKQHSTPRAVINPPRLRRANCLWVLQQDVTSKSAAGFRQLLQPNTFLSSRGGRQGCNLHLIPLDDKSP